MRQKPELTEERVTEIDIAASSMLLKRARKNLRNEVQVVRDLTFLLTQPLRLTPRQSQAVNDAMKTSLEVIAILATKYAIAGTELKAAHMP